MGGDSQSKVSFLSLRIEILSRYCVHRRGAGDLFYKQRKRAFSEIFLRNEHVYLEALWPIKVSKITLELLFLFLTDLKS